MLKNAKMKLWFMSSQEYTNTISLGYKTGILPEDVTVWHINEKSIDQLKVLIRNKLE